MARSGLISKGTGVVRIQVRRHRHRGAPGQAAVVAARHEDAVVRLEAVSAGASLGHGIARGRVRERRLRPEERRRHEADEDVPLVVELQRRVRRPLVEARRQRHRRVLPGRPPSCETATPIPA